MRAGWSERGLPGAVTITVVWLMVGGLALSACGSEGVSDPGTTTGPTVQTPTGYPRPDRTVSVLLEALAAGDWAAAAGITVEGQMALVALAEGADIETVSDYLHLGDRGVGTNFWAGFTQVVEGFLSGSVQNLQVTSRRSYQADGRSFADFRLALPASPEDRTFKMTLARSDDQLWRVDVIATFVDVLAYRLSETAEIARATRTEDAVAVSDELRRHVASLHAALADPDLSAESTQGVRSALAAIQ